MGVCDNKRPEEEDVPDQSYDFLILQKTQKDGLDVYKPKDNIVSSFKIKCPLCKLKLSKEEYDIIANKLIITNEQNLFDLIYKYNNEIKTPYPVDNISILENIYNEINECSRIIEENRYYKHTCKNNKLSQRLNNQDIYIDICYSSNLNNIIHNSLDIDINRLKIDENYKNNYISNREIKFNNYLKKQRKEEIENKYRKEFEDITSLKEQFDYQVSINAINYQIEQCNQRNEFFKSHDLPNDIRIDEKLSAEGLWYAYEYKFRYSGSRKKLKNYIEDKTNESIYFPDIKMKEWEYEEFQKFILQREPEYSEFIRKIN